MYRGRRSTVPQLLSKGLNRQMIAFITINV